MSKMPKPITVGDFDGDVQCPIPGYIQLTRMPANYIAPDLVATAKAWLENGQVGKVCNELSVHNIPFDLDRDWEPEYADFGPWPNKKEWR